MSIGRMIVFALALTLAGGVIGAGIGCLMGICGADFYMSAFDAHDAVQFGIGAGVAQGTTMGFILACVIIIAQTIIRKNKPID